MHTPGTAAVSVCVACLAMPAIATAARLELRPATLGTKELVYTAGAGEVNDLGMRSDMFSHYVQDFVGPPTERVPPCEATPEPGGPGTSSRCPTMADRAIVDLGDGDDLGDVDENTQLFIPVTVLGGPGRDRISMHSPNGNVLDGGSGDDVVVSDVPLSDVPVPYVRYPAPPGPGDTVAGGDGDDELVARNLRRDVVQCGPGEDTVTADAIDDVAADCERVNVDPERWARADGRPIGVTINRGARFTRSARVRLAIRAPDAAGYLRISNDGVFDAFLRVHREADERYRFELASGAHRRKTVYVRFDGPDLNPIRTVTDDIILDRKRPLLHRVRVLSRTRRGLHVALRARDSISAIRTAEFARVRARPFAPVRYRKDITTGRSARWARVRDGAGNASRWRRIGR